MFVEILIALSCLFIQPTIHHYIGNFDECTASKVCNHTWTPVCGNLEADSSNRLFLDDCDLHEYNCDNNTTYVEVDSQVCSVKCTQSDHAHAETTPMPPTPPTPKVSTIKSTEGTKTDPTKVTSTKKEEKKDKTDTSTNFVAPTTITITTAETKTTRQTSEITTETPETTQLTEKTFITNVNTPTTTERQRQRSTVTEKTTTTELPQKIDENDIIDDENTIPGDTKEASTKTTSVATTTKPNGKRGCYSHCSMPSTWETTAVGETRDFVQILRERYGDRIKILRDTTHYPKNPIYARKHLAFIPGYHMERRKQRFY